MNISVEHVAIPADDPVALKNWYERVLGAREIFNNCQNPPTCLISLGNIWLEIYAAEVPAARAGKQPTRRCSFVISPCAWIRWTQQKWNRKSAAEIY